MPVTSPPSVPHWVNGKEERTARRKVGGWGKGRLCWWALPKSSGERQWNSQMHLAAHCWQDIRLLQAFLQCASLARYCPFLLPYGMGEALSGPRAGGEYLVPGPWWLPCPSIEFILYHLSRPLSWTLQGQEGAGLHLPSHHFPLFWVPSAWYKSCPTRKIESAKWVPPCQAQGNTLFQNPKILPGQPCHQSRGGHDNCESSVWLMFYSAHILFFFMSVFGTTSIL